MPRIYRIRMDTPMGKCTGIITLSSHGGRVEGTLRVFDRTEPLFGDCLADGTCRLFGKFATLMRAYPFRAIGRIADDRLELELYSDGGVYQLHGLPDALAEAISEAAAENRQQPL